MIAIIAIATTTAQPILSDSQLCKRKLRFERLILMLATEETGPTSDAITDGRLTNASAVLGVAS